MGANDFKVVSYIGSVPEILSVTYYSLSQLEVVLVYEGKQYWVLVEDGKEGMEALYFPSEEHLPDWLLTIQDSDLDNLLKEIRHKYEEA